MKPEKKLRNHFGGAENLEMQKKLFDVFTETQTTSNIEQDYICIRLKIHPFKNKSTVNTHEIHMSATWK